MDTEFKIIRLKIPVNIHEIVRKKALKNGFYSVSAYLQFMAVGIGNGDVTVKIVPERVA